eukprot:1157014-Pelagomonas_calceolata.AAC.2
MPQVKSGSTSLIQQEDGEAQALSGSKCLIQQEDGQVQVMSDRRTLALLRNKHSNTMGVEHSPRGYQSLQFKTKADLDTMRVLFISILLVILSCQTMQPCTMGIRQI